jgi:hypothetical protein
MAGEESSFGLGNLYEDVTTPGGAEKARAKAIEDKKIKVDVSVVNYKRDAWYVTGIYPDKLLRLERGSDWTVADPRDVTVQSSD